MPRFSQQFLNQMTQPGLFGMGVQQVAQDIGNIPQRMQQRRMLEQFMSGDPTQRAQIVQQQAMRTGDLGLAMQGVEMQEAATQRVGNDIIQPLLTELSSPETSDERAKEIRDEIFGAARTYNIDESRVRSAYTATNKARLTSAYETLNAQTQELSMRAKQALSSGTDRETFVAQYGEENGYIFDDEKALREKNQLALETARANRAKAEFTYTDTELRETLGLTDVQIKQIKGIRGGEAKNRAVENAVIANFKDTQLNASLLRFMAGARLADVAKREGLDLDDEDERREAESIAAKEVLELYKSGGTSAVAGSQAEAQTQEQGQEGFNVEQAIAELYQSLGTQAD